MSPSAPEYPLMRLSRPSSRFEGPDPLTPENENQGRRIDRVAGGSIVLNPVKHREQLAREETTKQDAENNEDWEGLSIG